MSFPLYIVEISHLVTRTGRDYSEVLPYIKDLNDGMDYDTLPTPIATIKPIDLIPRIMGKVDDGVKTHSSALCAILYLFTDTSYTGGTYTIGSTDVVYQGFFSDEPVMVEYDEAARVLYRAAFYSAKSKGLTQDYYQLWNDAVNEIMVADDDDMAPTFTRRSRAMTYSQLLSQTNSIEQSLRALSYQDLVTVAYLSGANMTSYVNWEDCITAISLAGGMWATQEKVVQVATRMLSRNFSIAVERVAARDDLENMFNLDINVSSGKRFPNTGRYISSAQYEIVEAMRRLNGALVYKDPEGSTTLSKGENSRAPTNFSDASQSFYHAAKELTTLAGKRHISMNQTSFEAVTGLNWA